MLATYKVDGITCGNCVIKVRDSLEAISTVLSANVDREKGTVQLRSLKQLSIAELQNALPKKYTIHPLLGESSLVKGESKWKQLRPLFLVLGGVLLVSLLMNQSNFSISEYMFDFMGVFLISFSLFKFLDYKGFPDSFSMYDPLAKQIKIYAWSYPFIELALGIAFLIRFQLKWIIVITMILLMTTTIGVLQSILSKRKIQCACLGTALKLPMTEATLIENVLMISMGIIGLMMI